MHFQVNASDINYGMNMVCRALSARPAHQVYEGVFIETISEGVMMTCTDGEMTIKAIVPAQVAEDGCAVMPAKLLSELLRKIGGNIDISVDQKFRASIRAQGSNTNMSCMEAEDFPDIKDITGDFVTEMQQKQFRDAISKVTFAISTDETRKILTGCLMEICAEETRFVGLDGFRLALQRVSVHHDMPEKTDQLEAIIPGNVLVEISHMLGDTDEKAKIACSKSHMMLSFGSIRVYSTLLAGEYINYKQILPSTWQTEIKLRRDDFSVAIERASLMAREGKNNLLKLHLDEDKMTITANAERGAALEEIPISFNGSSLDIAFNARYLADVIHNVDSDEICMRFNSNVSPCIVSPVEGNRFTYLVLPVRLFGNN